MPRARGPLSSAVAEVARELESWRRTRRGGAIPEGIWRKAVGLARRHGVHAVKQALGLDYPYGDPVLVTDARGNTVQITVDAEGYVTEVKAPSPLSYRRRLHHDLDRNVTMVEVENLDRTGTPDCSASQHSDDS